MSTTIESARNREAYKRARLFWQEHEPKSRVAWLWGAYGAHGYPSDKPPAEHFVELVSKDFDDLPNETVDDVRQIMAIGVLVLDIIEEFALDRKNVRFASRSVTFAMPREDGGKFRDIFTVYSPHRAFSLRKNDFEEAGINWSACGTQTPEIAEEFGRLLIAGAALASRMPDPRPESGDDD